MKHIDLLAYYTVLLPSFTLSNRDLLLKNSIDQLLQRMCEHFFFGLAHRHRLNFSDPLVAKELYKLVQQILNRGILPEPNRFLSSSYRAFIIGI